MIIEKRLTHPNATVRYLARRDLEVRRELASIDETPDKAERKRENQRERAMR